MIRDHRYYEMQGSLAAAGQLSDVELAELEEHADDCASCRAWIAEMAGVSLELFLIQNQKRVSATGIPAGMQERFLQRAANAGIPVGCAASTMLDIRFPQIAAIALLIPVFFLLSWRVLSVPSAERAAVQDSHTIDILPGHALAETSVLVPERKVQNISASGTQIGRRSTARHRVVSTSPTRGTLANRQSNWDLSGLSFGSRGSMTSHYDRKTAWYGTLPVSYVWDSMQSASPSSFTRARIESLFAHKVEYGPSERAFHYDLNLDSLRFQNLSLVAGLEPHVSGWKFKAPEFLLDTNQVW